MSRRRLTCVGTGSLTLVADAYGHVKDPAVLLLHGGGQTRHSWGATATTLAASGYYAVSADLRGHGESAWAPEGDYTFAAFQGDVEAWCDLLHQPVIVGASMGGLAAMWTEGSRSAAGQPPAGRALVLVDIAHRSEEQGIQRIVAFMSSNPDGFASIDEAADAVATYLPGRPRPTSNDGLARNLRLGGDGRYRWHWDPAFMNSGRPRPSGQLDIFAEHAQWLTVPVLLVRGKMSDVVSEEAAREFVELVPQARYVDVGNARHMVAGDHNDAFTAEVLAFLHELDATNAGQP